MNSDAEPHHGPMRPVDPINRASGQLMRRYGTTTTDAAQQLLRWSQDFAMPAAEIARLLVCGHSKESR